VYSDVLLRRSQGHSAHTDLLASLASPELTAILVRHSGAVKVDPADVETNLVFFDETATLHAPTALQHLLARRIDVMKRLVSRLTKPSSWPGGARGS